MILVLGAALWLGPETKEVLSRWLSPGPAATMRTALSSVTDPRYAPLRQAWGDD